MRSRSTKAETLQRLLEGDPPTGEVPAGTQTLAQLAGRLEPSSAPAPRAAFRTELRDHLVAEARRQQPAPSLLGRLRQRVDAAATRWRYSTRLAAATGAAVLAISGGGTAVAVDRAMPSDALYPVKLAAEDLRVQLISDRAGQAERYLAYADERLDDAEQAAATDDYRGAAIALREGDERARRAAGLLIGEFQASGDRAPLSQLGTSTLEQRQRLQALSPQLAGDARGAARAWLVSLQRIEARLAAVVSGCLACPTSGPPQEGVAFDFTVIPAANEPFIACPCNGPSGRPAEGAAEPRQEPSGESDGGERSDDGSGGLVPGPVEVSDDPVSDPADGLDDPAPPADEAVPEATEDTGEVVEDVIRDLLEGEGDGEGDDESGDEGDDESGDGEDADEERDGDDESLLDEAEETLEDAEDALDEAGDGLR